jgi:hypothetical protein
MPSLEVEAVSPPVPATVAVSACLVGLLDHAKATKGIAHVDTPLHKSDFEDLSASLDHAFRQVESVKLVEDEKQKKHRRWAVVEDVARDMLLDTIVRKTHTLKSRKLLAQKCSLLHSKQPQLTRRTSAGCGDSLTC